jgi:hypothetical protein
MSGMKRLLFPDGCKFEGMGIQPDIEIRMIPEDYANPINKVLNMALIRTFYKDSHQNSYYVNILGDS